jgi:hypothetical protein
MVDLAGAEDVAQLRREVDELKRRINSPRVRLLVENWVIEENTNGDLTMRNKVTGTVHTFDKD